MTKENTNKKKRGVFYVAIFAIITMFTLFAALRELVSVLPEIYIEIPAAIEVSYDIKEVPLLSDIAKNNRLERALTFAANKLLDIAEKTAKAVAGLLQNTGVIVTLFIFIVAAIGFFLAAGYIEHRKRIFSVTPYLNKVLETKNYLLKASSGRIQKRRITALFKEIIEIEAAKY